MKLYPLSAVCFFPVESGCPVRLNSIRQLSETWLSPNLPAGSPYSGLLTLLASLLELRKFSFYLECVVYGKPHLGGATEGTGHNLNRLLGLSPRGRGNLSHAEERAAGVRSIPAWAGQPKIIAALLKQEAVYPRVGGATFPPILQGPLDFGLSPRGRGNPHHENFFTHTSGSIPAWAGQPFRWLAKNKSFKVYPRVGGATRTAWSASKPSRGLSPRGRGNLPKRLSIDLGQVGLSPRGRGNRSDTLCGSGHAGSIPAWAGQPPFEKYCQRLFIYIDNYRYLTRYTPSASTISFGDSPNVLISCPLAADGSRHVITMDP